MQQDKDSDDESSDLRIVSTNDEALFAYYATRLMLSCQRLYGMDCSISAHLAKEVAAMTHGQVQLTFFTQPSLAAFTSDIPKDWIAFPIQWDNLHYGTLYMNDSDRALSLTSAQQLTQLCAWLLRTLKDAAYVQKRRPPLTKEGLQKIAALTPRELDVLQLMIEGYSTDDIARELILSKRTVEQHQRGIYEKLNVNSSQEAIFIGLAAGFE